MLFHAWYSFNTCSLLLYFSYCSIQTLGVISRKIEKNFLLHMLYIFAVILISLLSQNGWFHLLKGIFSLGTMDWADGKDENSKNKAIIQALILPINVLPCPVNKMDHFPKGFFLLQGKGILTKNEYNNFLSKFLFLFLWFKVSVVEEYIKERNTMTMKHLRCSTYVLITLWSWISLIKNLHAAWLREWMLSVECWLNWVEAINSLCHLLMLPEDSVWCFTYIHFFFFFLQATRWNDWS